ncbi:MAG: hypothetical protein JF604_23340 [Bradyrhizobium sp.]|nr:hypothetical protein [Bradyrhizobium sp.]
MFRPRIRLYTVFLALGAFVAGVAPYAVRAQSGDALAHAEQTCLDNGVGPNTVTFDTCVARAAHALVNGEPEAAAAEALRLADARQACMSYDIDPMTLGYHQCIASETRRHYATRSVPGSARY